MVIFLLNYLQAILFAGLIYTPIFYANRWDDSGINWRREKIGVILNIILWVMVLAVNFHFHKKYQKDFNLVDVGKLKLFLISKNAPDQQK